MGSNALSQEERASIAKFESLADRVDALRGGVSQTSPAFIGWHRMVELAIEHTFGSGSSHAALFANVDFTCFFSQQGYLDGLNEAQTLLKSFVYEIQEYGVQRQDVDESQPRADSAAGANVAVPPEKMPVKEFIGRLSAGALAGLVLGLLGLLSTAFFVGLAVGQAGGQPVVQPDSPQAKSAFLIIDSQREVHGGDIEAAALVDSFRLRWKKKETGVYGPTTLVLQTSVPLLRPPVIISADASLVNVGVARELLSNRWEFDVSAPGINAPAEDLESRETLPALRFRVDLQY